MGRFTLSCESVERWLASQPPGETSRAIEEHLARCESCRRERDDSADLRHLLSRAFPDRPRVAAQGSSPGSEAAARTDPLLTRAIMAGIRRQPASPARRRRWTSGAGWRAAAVLVGAGLIALVARPLPRELSQASLEPGSGQVDAVRSARSTPDRATMRGTDGLVSPLHPAGTVVPARPGRGRGSAPPSDGFGTWRELVVGAVDAGPSRKGRFLPVDDGEPDAVTF